MDKKIDLKLDSQNTPLVNIVIITTNQFSFIGECIRSVLSANYKNITVYLIDNNSDKASYDKFYKAHKRFKKLKFFRLDKNYGFAGACNFAIKQIKKGYVVLLNDDTIVSTNWLGPIISYMEKHPDVGACQPKIRSMRKKSYFEYAGAGGGFMDVYGYPFCRGRIFFNLEKDKGQYDDIADVVWTSGNCLVTKVNVIKKIGLLDEIFFIYGEEADWCWRMYYHGFRLAYIPSSVVYHYGSGTMGATTPKKIYLHHRNGLILLFKNYTRTELIQYVPFRIFLDFVAFWFYLLVNRLPLNAFALVKAYIAFIFLLPKIVARRKDAAFKKNVNPNPYPLYKKSIIIDYFLRGKKKYSQL